MYPFARRKDTPAALPGSDGDPQILLVDANGRLHVTQTGTGATSLGKAEDSVHASGDTGTMVLGVTNQSLTNQTSAIDGDYGAIALTQKGQALVAPGFMLTVGDNVPASGGIAIYDKSSNTGPTYTAGFNFNASTWDRQRNNMDQTVLASAARTAAVSSADQTNYNGQGADIVFHASAISLTPVLTFTIEGKDIPSGQYYPILVSAATAITAGLVIVFRVGPGNETVANLSISRRLPRTWRVSVAVADTDSVTYSIGASIIL